MASEGPKTHNVVVAVDESDQAKKALEYYVEYLHKPGNNVIIAHCLEIPYIPSPAHPDVVSRILNDKRAGAKVVEQNYIAAMKEKGIECKVVMSDFDFGPGHFIVDAAQRQHAGMIVMGCRGMGTIRRTLMGSVSDYVVHHAHCPVTVVRN